MITTAIILAGGRGERLQHLTDNTPKPLLKIQNKPLLTHVLENLKKHGVTNIILSIGYCGDQIKSYYNDGRALGLNILYVEENEPLGTGGAVKLAAQNLKEPFFLVWADNLANYDYSVMGGLKNGTDIIMAVTPRDDVENFGVVKLRGDEVVGFVEKPEPEDAPSNLVNAGAFIIEPELLGLLPDGMSSIERDLFEKVASGGHISAFVHEGEWYPTDTIEKLNLAELSCGLPSSVFKGEETVIN